MFSVNSSVLFLHLVFLIFLVLLSINGPITDNETSLASAPGPQTRGSMTVLLLCNLYPIHVVVEYIVPVHALAAGNRERRVLVHAMAY